jgi:hypothetical protein
VLPVRSKSSQFKLAVETLKSFEAKGTVLAVERHEKGSRGITKLLKGVPNQADMAHPFRLVSRNGGRSVVWDVKESRQGILLAD